MLKKGLIVRILRDVIGFRTTDELLVVPCEVKSGTIGKVVEYWESDDYGYIETSDKCSVDFCRSDVEIVVLK